MRNIKILKKHQGQKAQINTQADEKPDGVSNTSIIEDEFIRAKIRKLIDAPKPSPIWERFSTNPLVAVVVGFLLTGIIGASLAYYYNKKQQELEFSHQVQQRNLDRERDNHEKELEEQKADLARKFDVEHADHQKELEFQRYTQQRELERERSFTDELSKTRVTKISEVWEKVYIYEATSDAEIKAYGVVNWESVERIVRKFNRSKTREEKTKVIQEMVETLKQERKKLVEQNGEYKVATETAKSEVLKVLNANRFWLDGNEYSEVRRFIDVTQEYTEALAIVFLDSAASKRAQELSKERDRLRQSVIRMMHKFINK